MKNTVAALALLFSFSLFAERRVHESAQREVAPDHCSSFAVSEAKKAIDEIKKQGKDAWYSLGQFSQASPSSLCPEVSAYCYAACVVASPQAVATCSGNCNLAAGTTACSEADSQAGLGAIEACGKLRGDAWYCLQYFAYSPLLKCPGMSAACMRVCEKNSPVTTSCAAYCVPQTIKKKPKPPVTPGYPPSKPPIVTPTVPTTPTKPTIPTKPTSDLEFCARLDPLRCLDYPKRCNLLSSNGAQGIGTSGAYLCCAIKADFMACRRAAGYKD